MPANAYCKANQIFKQGLLKVKKITVNIFFLFLIFSDLVFTIFPLPDFMKYWDELLFLLLILWYGMNLIQKVHYNKLDKADIKILMCFVGITVIGILGNIIFGYAYSIGSIIRDIFGFAKFPLTYIVFRELHYDTAVALIVKKYSISFLKLITVIIFTLGIVSLFQDIGLSQDEIRFGVRPYQFLFHHPTYLVLASICILACLAASEKKNENFIFFIMLLTIIGLSMRSKGFAIAGVAFFMRYFGKDFVKHKHKFVLIGIVFIIAFALGYSQLKLYMSYSNSPREAMYIGCLQLMKQCFPIGSGFGTFASHVSGTIGMRSKVYSFIYIPGAFSRGYVAASIGDTGYPYYLGQFGFLGAILFINMMRYIYNGVSKQGIATQIIFFYILIALTSETILLNNGFELAIVLTTVDKMGNITSKLRASI